MHSVPRQPAAAQRGDDIITLAGRHNEPGGGVRTGFGGDEGGRREEIEREAKREARSGNAISRPLRRRLVASDQTRLSEGRGRRVSAREEGEDVQAGALPGRSPRSCRVWLALGAQPEKQNPSNIWAFSDREEFRKGC